MAFSYGEAKRMLAEEPLPAAVIDVDAFDRNLDRLLAASSDLLVRLASKSLRVPSLLRRALARGGARMRGVMTYDIGECEHLARAGFDDLLLAYPLARDAALRRAVALVERGTSLRITVDDADTLARAAASARARGVELPVVVCVDMSLRALAGRVHLGVRRSPLHTTDEVVAFARRIAETGGVRFAGLLAYEAQIAGVADDSPHHRGENTARALVRHISAREVQTRRRQMVDALTAQGLAPPLVNGGGTGSLDSTGRAGGVDEVTFGSGLYKPHSFDGYRADYLRSLEPAAFFALEITRRPAPHHVTCLGGGYVASGSAGRERLPLPVLPSGLALLGGEGAGEVQTPLHGASADQLALGDPVLFRHAKAGELLERFDQVLLVSNGSVVDRASTYRGEGLTTA